jgi:hypothetical protein
MIQSVPASRQVLMPILDQRFVVVSPAATFGRQIVAERSSRDGA